MATILFLVIPLAMTALIGAIFNPGSGTETKLPAIKLLLVDKDKGLAAKFLTGAFDQKEVKEMFQVTLVQEAEGEKLMKKGKASAMLVIPEHFSDDLAEQKTSALLVVKNPAEEFLPGVAEEFANTMAVGLSAIAQVFADELKVIKSASKLELEDISIAQMTPFHGNGPGQDHRPQILPVAAAAAAENQHHGQARGNPPSPPASISSPISCRAC